MVSVSFLASVFYGSVLSFWPYHPRLGARLGVRGGSVLSFQDFDSVVSEELV